MADGCNLYFTEKDLNQVEESLQKGNQHDEVQTASNILNGRLTNDVKGFKEILSNKNDARHSIVQQLLEKSLSNGKLISDDAGKLSEALNAVLRVQENIQGLFENPPKHRGPGADSMKHGGELLATAAIIQKTATERGIRTSLGNKLHIDNRTDIIGFGQKLPSKFALPSRKKGTIEADTLISRVTKRDPILGDEHKLIAIDTKYSKTSSTYGVLPGLDRQLKGIRNALNDGSIKEFYFVSNVKFSESFHKNIDSVNRDLIIDRVSENKDLYADIKHATKTEQNSIKASELVSKLNYETHRDTINKITREYGIPQVGICEKVTFE